MKNTSSLTLLCVVVLALALLVSDASAADPARFKQFLLQNVFRDCPPVMPLSYNIYPKDYFARIPANNRVPPQLEIKNPIRVPECDNQMIQPGPLNAYAFQTEEMIVRFGLNIYDGAVWMTALSVLGEYAPTFNYFDEVLVKHKTCQWQSTMGDAPCKGVECFGECKDTGGGTCGLCYGPRGKNNRLAGNLAWFFKSISPLYRIEGNIDKRCPKLGRPWTWNSWQPVLGENSWARLIGPLQSAYLKVGKDMSKFPDDVIRFALNYLPSLKQMLIPEIGAVLYTPYNSYGIKASCTGDGGAEISTENQASTLAGLLMLRQILTEKNVYTSKLALVNTLITNIRGFMKSSWNAEKKFFKNGGLYNYETKEFKWFNDFAVDCQTWSVSVLGPSYMEDAFGVSSVIANWNATKTLGGYNYNPRTNTADGLGYDGSNSESRVLSGEWTFGAINMLRTLANIYTDPNVQAPLRSEADTMRATIERLLTMDVPMDGGKFKAIKYANKRYFIPFGWYSNSLPSTASTGWGVFADADFNPLYLGGEFRVYGK
eukprot:TRINITY_DN8868_c0_g1_i1.p1 TRINITY_DN8868_c0_g1~~TRINITY_DN8868_c0_g1_i1.p1  ORF type:complete len:554 (+),score=122.11 TRINITY_DN8868_c0_g1_i1:35-1663(+)